MTRRFLFPLAAGVVGLLAISPVLASEQTTTAANIPAKATSTTAPADDSAGSSGDPSSDPSADPGTDPGSDSGTGSGSESGSGSDSGSTDTTDTTDTTGKNGKNGSSASTATTGKSGPGSGSGSGSGSEPGRSSSVCDPPEIEKNPAPQVGDPPQSYEASDAGSVEVERLSETELRIVKATANDGWTEQVATPSGPRVTVKFTRQGESPTLIRFAASMDQRGTMIHTRVTSCG